MKCSVWLSSYYVLLQVECNDLAYNYPLPQRTNEQIQLLEIWVSWIKKKKKIPQGLRGKKYTNQFSQQSKGAVTVEDYWTECQYYVIVWVCFMFGNCNHCCFCCGHPFTMLGVSWFISCKNKIQSVGKKKEIWVFCVLMWLIEDILVFNPDV